MVDDERLHEDLVELVVEWLDVVDVSVVSVDESDDNNVVDDASSQHVVGLVSRVVDDDVEVLDD